MWRTHPLSFVFVHKVAARWNTTVEGAIEVEKDIQFDKALYDELRSRRDFGFEQVGVFWLQ